MLNQVYQGFHGIFLSQIEGAEDNQVDSLSQSTSEVYFLNPGTAYLFFGINMAHS